MINKSLIFKLINKNYVKVILKKLLKKDKMFYILSVIIYKSNS